MCNYYNDIITLIRCIPAYIIPNTIHSRQSHTRSMFDYCKPRLTIISLSVCVNAEFKNFVSYVTLYICRVILFDFIRIPLER